jgi:hypothetical protein
VDAKRLKVNPKGRTPLVAQKRLRRRFLNQRQQRRPAQNELSGQQQQVERKGNNMAYGKTMKKSSGKKMPFKTCKGCPTPAKCKKMGRCMGKSKK